ncbi:MAG: hypothetical protein K6B28_11550 [Lachnospiraceae bacterium]|nr:hypothetical protein [Lachnospiraceae bacterium]
MPYRIHHIKNMTEKIILLIIILYSLFPFTIKADTNIPSDLPEYTITSFSGSTKIDLKALDTDKRSYVNHELLASDRADSENLKYEILDVKNVYPLWNAKEEWKNSRRSINWTDLPVKRGEDVYAIWFCETADSMAKYIPCFVGDGGTVSFVVPKLGDMSTISIVRYK